MQDIQQETLNECTKTEQSALIVLWEIDLTEVGGDRYFFCKRKLTAVCSHQTRIGNLDAHLI